MTLYFKITGGMYPYQYRSTAVRVRYCETIGDGYPAVSNWCRAYFPDYNNISTIEPTAWFVATLNAQLDIPLYHGGKRKF